MRAAALVLLFASAAVAQTPPLDLEQTLLDPAARGSLWVGNGQTLKGGGFRVSTPLTYAHGQLKSQSDSGGTSTLLRDRFVLHVLGAVGITSWLEFSGDLPVIVDQTSEAAGVRPNPYGLGTPFLNVKVSILDRLRPVALSVALGVGLPVGDPGAFGNGGLAFAPRVNLGRAFQAIQLGAELGMLLRPRNSLERLTGSAHDRVGSQLYLAATAAGIGDGLRGEVSARAFVSLANTPPGLELLTGVRYPIRDFELFALIGPGIGGAPTTATLRLLVGGAFGNGGPPHGRCDARDEYPIAECPDLDFDNDGVPNGVDLAPTLPEDRDGFQDEDGKPDPDNDNDGLLDVEDLCPNTPGPRENSGCPDSDSDGDGVMDSVDACPAEPGKVEDHGCPTPE